MRGNTDQKNFAFGQVLRSGMKLKLAPVMLSNKQRHYQFGHTVGV